MSDKCICCKKEITSISWDLKDGCVCDNCYEKALKCSSKLSHRNIKLYSSEEILNILNSGENESSENYSVILKSTNNHSFEVIKEIRELKRCDLTTAKSIIDSTPSIICTMPTKPEAEAIIKKFEYIGASVEVIKGSQIETQENENEKNIIEEPIQNNYRSEGFETSESRPEKKSSFFSNIKIIFSVAVLLLILIGWINPSFQNKIVNWVVETFTNVNDEAYIEMAKDVDFIDGMTYGQWLDGNDYFESREWTYYKEDGNKYVKFNGAGKGDVLQVIFSLECVNQKEDIYLITPERVSVNGVPITNLISIISLFGRSLE